MANEVKRRIIGVDPGTNILGWAVIEVEKNKISILEMGIVQMSHLKEQQYKLKKIFEKLHQIIQIYKPWEMAIEAPFFGKNVQSMLKLGRAQGVAMAAGITNNVLISEYSPRKIKKSITGNGNASKEQVAAMLESILSQKIDEKHNDVTDALATAICHHFNSNSPLAGKKQYKGWGDYLKNNPGKRVK